MKGILFIMTWVTMIAGITLFLTPFISGYSNSPAALWTSLIMGAVIAVLGYMRNYKWAAVAGLLTFVSPWALGFSGIPAALWDYVVIGAVVAIGNGYLAFSQKSTHGSQHA
jgi:hypothetical protein